jgi:curli production assembly/transport component CsgE
MVMIFLGTSGQPSITSTNFLEMLPSVDPLDLEIEGIIVDATQTKVGRDFYDIFFSNWEPAENLPNLSVVISERPLPTRGTQVIVTIEENVVFQRFVQPRIDEIEENSLEAVQLATQYLENYQTVQKQLQGDDLIGTGIY